MEKMIEQTLYDLREELTTTKKEIAEAKEKENSIKEYLGALNERINRIHADRKAALENQLSDEDQFLRSLLDVRAEVGRAEQDYENARRNTEKLKERYTILFVAFAEIVSATSYKG